MAEASLMSLLEAMLALAARPALVTRPTINVKAGGYPEELFLDMSEEQKEEVECCICYQVLKEVMECRNKHKFCYTCIQVWSTTGEYLNRIRCPVCRCEGHYSRNPDLDLKIEMKRVKCSMDGCTWKGLLRYSGTHKHSNYQAQSSSSSTTPNLPQLKTNSQRPSDSMSRLQPRSLVRSRLTPSTSDRNNNLVSRSTSVDAEAVALSQEINNNAFLESEPTSPIAPIPPQTPRPSNLTRRRVPTLPSLVHNSSLSPLPPAVAPASTQPSITGTGLLSRRRASQGQAPTTFSAASGNLTTVRDRLVESRNRLQGLVSSFGEDDDRQVPEVETFHEEREYNRQQQMQEVHELGRRLGQVARELRELLDHRRNNRSQSTSSSESDD
ncbi:hypothetical protein LOTGIDRAFT_238735 [Lottia gigantea]|uniref:RING-type domain-containing protein n=1 Tax=Lottia gigantea TaxID=225164 RepID=V4A729_LOTGI|nr:hypothetical protein LOTGIDRAFT_238735 [Lottia gigantea]ESO99738.1 hypothetical protein LOTGIDRAFT_238735 [Lottia gigantea]